MDFGLGESAEQYRDEVRAFLAAHVDDAMIERSHQSGTNHDWDLHRALADAGYLAAGWPTEYGGHGRDPLEMTALTEELYLSGAPVDGLGIVNLVAHTIMICGTANQKAELLPGMIRGETMCCLGYSEPEAGSDVAAAATRAERDGDEWVINGQKMFTTMAHEAHYVFLLARTNLDVAKHKGLTMFLVPMDSPGIEITPVHTMASERTNITFYDNVRVPDRLRIGDVDGGWTVMTTALAFERNSSWWGEAVRLLDHTVEWAASTHRDDGTRVIDDAVVRERLARCAIDNEVSRLLGHRAAWMASRGELPHVEGTMAKLFTTEAYQHNSSELLDILGEEGLVRHDEPDAASRGVVEHSFRHSTVTTIYGGTSEIMRGIVAERGLGLPRSR